MTAGIQISVVIPAHNEERYIARVLEALRAQTLPAEQFEVIVMDDRSTDRTAELVRAAALPNLRLESMHCGSISEVRNRGAALARAPLLLFLDGDCAGRPDLLATGLALSEPRTLWGAHYLTAPDAAWPAQIWARFQAKEQRGVTNFLPGCTLFVARADFQQIGGFAQNFETSEDVDFCQRAHLEHGMQLLAYPELAVYHYGTPQTLRAFFHQNRWHGKHVLRSFLNRPTGKTAALLGLSAYTLLTFLGGAIALCCGLVTRHWLLAALAPVPLLVPPALIALVRTLKANRLQDTPALGLLYLLYLLARAQALVQTPPRRHRT